MNEKTDPYDRTPLSLDQVIPQDTLKEEIKKFVMDKAKELKLL